MSDSVGHRLVTIFLRVKQRLESLLEFCRLHEHTPPVNNDEWEDRDRFRGPYRWDVEELETSISTLATLIANLQHEYDSNDDRNPIPDYPLCGNGWTMEQIDRLDTEREKQINLDTLAVLRLQTLNECIHKLNSQSSRSHVSIRHIVDIASSCVRFSMSITPQSRRRSFHPLMPHSIFSLFQLRFFFTYSRTYLLANWSVTSLRRVDVSPN